MILPVIMAGGTGSRLWPLSRQQFPKQFLSLDGDSSMLQMTIERLNGLNHHAPIIICNEEHRFTVAEQLRANEIDNSGILLEPVGKNTAPAVALSAIKAINDGSDPILLVLAADHVIKDNLAFQQAINQAANAVESGKLVTFGIVPTKPETGYGYIKQGAHFKSDEDNNSAPIFLVDDFVEKPSLPVAKQYLDSKAYLWNSGMFMFKASQYLEELKKYRPDILHACELAMNEVAQDLDFIRVNEPAFSLCPSESIDYAVMEHTEEAVVVSMNCGWSDVGSWQSLWEEADKDKNGNVIHGDVMSYDTHGSFIHSHDKLVATIGLSNVAIVETADAVLVANQADVQKVKNIVEQLKMDEREEYKHHRQVHRPWGKYDLIDRGDNFQVKRITVNPKAKLSLQMHRHRAEHWVVVSGSAKVTKGDTVFTLGANESCFIPIGTTHALENPTEQPLEIIEVQSGSYLGEDDIVRYEDIYGRVNELHKGE